MKFTQVKDPYHPPYWMVFITTSGELVDWYMQQPNIKDAVRDLFQNVAIGKHGSTRISRTYECGFLKYNSLPELAQQLSDLMFAPKMAALDAGPS